MEKLKKGSECFRIRNDPDRGHLQLVGIPDSFSVLFVARAYDLMGGGVCLGEASVCFALIKIQDVK